MKRQHLALVDRLGDRPRGKVDPTAALAAAKIAEAETVEEAVSFLDNRASAPPSSRRPGWSKPWRAFPAGPASPRAGGGGARLIAAAPTGSSPAPRATLPCRWSMAGAFCP